jgi:hypothetical protein
MRSLFQDLTTANEFLTALEFEQFKDGKEFWFTAKEMAERGIATHVKVNGVEISAETWLSSLNKPFSLTSTQQPTKLEDTPPIIVDDNPTTPSIGDAFGGGYYAGEIRVSGDIYALVVAPNTAESSGQQVRWNTALEIFNKLTIGDHADWYLPSRDELDICYQNLNPRTSTIPEFKTGGAEAFVEGNYWSSTEFSTTDAWRQNFGDGDQYNNGKGYYNYVRAVRRVKLS